MGTHPLDLDLEVKRGIRISFPVPGERRRGGDVTVTRLAPYSVTGPGSTVRGEGRRREEAWRRTRTSPPRRLAAQRAYPRPVKSESALATLLRRLTFGAALTHDGSGWSAFVRTVGQHRGSDAYRTDAAWRSKSEERATTPWRPVGATTGHAPVGIPRMGCLPVPISLPSALHDQAKLGRMSERGAKPVQVQPRTRVALPQKPDGPANPTLRRPAP